MVTDGATLHAGETFGDFFIERLLRADALTETYLARCEGRTVALKCRDLGRAAAPPSAEAFAAGVSRLRGLRDEGIPAVIDGGIQDSVAWLATAHIAGNTLRDLLHTIPPHMYTYLLGQALEWAVTIQTAHGAGFLHGDLRPENIAFDMASDEPGSRIIDIGCADLFGMTPAIAAHTPLYRAPEQLSGGKVDARADIYSFGMIIYEMLALRPPFSGRDGAMPNLLKLRTMAIQEMPTPLQKVHRVFPKFVADLVWKAIAKAPQERFQLMAELIEALEDASERIEPWASVYEDGAKIPAAERARIRRELDGLPARAAQSGHRLTRAVRFGLDGYEAPPLDPAGDTDPAGPPEIDAAPAKRGAAEEEKAQDKQVRSGGAPGGGAPGASRGAGAPGLRLAQTNLDGPGLPFVDGADVAEEGASEEGYPEDEPPAREQPEGETQEGETQEVPQTLRTAPQMPSEVAERRPSSSALGCIQRMLLAQPAAVVLIIAVAAGLSLDVASRRDPPHARPPILIAALKTRSHPAIAAPETYAAAQPMASGGIEGAGDAAGAQSSAHAEDAAGAQKPPSAGNVAGSADARMSGAAAAAPRRARPSGAAMGATPPPLSGAPPPTTDADEATAPASAVMKDEKLNHAWLAKRWSRGVASERAQPRSRQQ